jgi:hypothetical protein
MNDRYADDARRASGSVIIDKTVSTAWRLDVKCDGRVAAQLEGPAGR